MQEKRKLFGSSGIRGSAEELFTNQFAFDIGRVFAAFLKESKVEGRVAIGMDPRDSSPRIKKAVASGILSEGFDVADQGVAPIPSINYMLKLDSIYCGSLMVSGSHIKPALNGLKFFAFGEEILKNHERRIEELYFQLKNQKPFVDQSDKIILEDRARVGYREYLKSKSLPFPKWKVVTDTGNGAQSETFPVFLEDLGFEVVKLNASVQMNFLSRDTEVSGDFGELAQEVVKQKADFGIGFDSDGDRVVFLDEKGDFIPGDYTGALISRSLKNENLVTPINTSQVVDHIGKKVHRTKVGSPYVVEKMKEVRAAFGFEANGGGIYEEMMSRDGGRSAVEIMNLLTKSEKSLSELIGELPKFYISRDKIDYKWEFKDLIEDEVRKKFEGKKIEDLDGIKIWVNEDTWILYRSSQNAPEFRVFVESKDKNLSAQLLKEGIDFVKKVISEKT